MTNAGSFPVAIENHTVQSNLHYLTCYQSLKYFIMAEAAKKTISSLAMCLLLDIPWGDPFWVAVLATFFFWTGNRTFSSSRNSQAEVVAVNRHNSM